MCCAGEGGEAVGCAECTRLLRDRFGPQCACFASAWGTGAPGHAVASRPVSHSTRSLTRALGLRERSGHAVAARPLSSPTRSLRERSINPLEVGPHDRRPAIDHRHRDRHQPHLDHFVAGRVVAVDVLDLELEALAGEVVLHLRAGASTGAAEHYDLLLICHGGRVSAGGGEGHVRGGREGFRAGRTAITNG